MPRRPRALLAPLLALLLPALVFFLMLSALERRMVFPAPEVPRELLASEARRQGAQELTLSAEDGTALYGWWLPASGDSAGLVLYFSGNGSTVAAPIERYRRYTRAGFDLLHVNYRGYPGSEGQPSEAGLLQDARAAWAEARRRRPADEIVVHGTSLGGGVAVGLVAGLDEPPRGLLIESSFTAITAVAGEAFPWLPVRLLMKNRFDSLSKAPRIACPTLVVHGQEDQLIGVHHGRALAQALPRARLVEVPGAGHNDDLLAFRQAWEGVAWLLDPELLDPELLDPELLDPE